MMVYTIIYQSKLARRSNLNIYVWCSVIFDNKRAKKINWYVCLEEIDI